MEITSAQTTTTFLALFTWLQAKMAGQPRKAEPLTQQAENEMHFSRSQICELQAPLGVTIECASGQVWITMDHDTRDVLLAEGQTFTVDCDKRTLIMALDEASVRCIRPAFA